MLSDGFMGLSILESLSPYLIPVTEMVPKKHFIFSFPIGASHTSPLVENENLMLESHEPAPQGEKKCLPL